MLKTYTSTARNQKFLKHPTDVIFKIVIFLQLWVPSSKPKDKERLEWMAGELKKLYASMAPCRV
jgi:hypothetical protein